MAEQALSFEFQLPTRLVVGQHAVERIGSLCRGLGGPSVLLVTDHGLVDAGHAGRVEALLHDAGLRCARFDAVHENPTTDDIDACVEFARAHEPDVIVGLGGGSAIDAAKGCNFILTNGGTMHDYWGFGKASQPMLPLIAVPTTTGTGSEVQSFALISDAETHRKMACGDPKAQPRIALLDPELAISQPREVAACSGLDAIAHAVETAVTTKRNAVSRLFSTEAFRLAVLSFGRALEHPDDLEAQGNMMLAATYAGIAIEHSMLGAAHSAANPLTAQSGIIHGQAVGLMLPAVVRYNAQDSEARAEYVRLAHVAGLADASTPTERAVQSFIECLETQYAATDLPATLGACGVERAAIGSLARGAADQWTAQFNPRPVSERDFEELYDAAFGLGA